MVDQAERLRRAVLAAAAQDARDAARLIGVLQPRFAVLVEEVVATVGGSAQQVDRDMVAALQRAHGELDRAQALLHECVRRAGRVGGP